MLQLKLDTPVAQSSSDVVPDYLNVDRPDPSSYAEAHACVEVPAPGGLESPYEVPTDPEKLVRAESAKLSPREAQHFVADPTRDSASISPKQVRMLAVAIVHRTTGRARRLNPRFYGRCCLRYGGGSGET